MASIKNFLAGNLSRKTVLTRLIPLVLVVIFGSLFITGMFFPTEFDWRVMVLSALFVSKDNPDGYIYFSVAVVVIAVSLIPMLGYLHRRLNKICMGTTRTGSVFLIISIIGFLLMGIFAIYPPLGEILFNEDRMHEYMSFLGLVGLVLAYFFYGFSLLKDRKVGKRQINQPALIIGTIIMWIVFLGLVLSQGVLEIIEAVYEPDWPYVGIDWIDGTFLPKPPLVLSFALWEWLLVIGVFVYMVLLLFMIPEDVEAIPKKRKKQKEKAEIVKETSQ
ncbi:MAG: hypothetical protein ACFFCS_11680 [Candidatus Hodarchaeota archaeon]